MPPARSDDTQDGFGDDASDRSYARTMERASNTTIDAFFDEGSSSLAGSLHASGDWSPTAFDAIVGSAHPSTVSSALASPQASAAMDDEHPIKKRGFLLPAAHAAGARAKEVAAPKVREAEPASHHETVMRRIHTTVSSSCRARWGEVA